MTLRPTATAAAIVFGLALSPLLGTVPAVAQTSPGPPTEIALVVPLTVPADSESLISADRLESYTSEFGLLNRALDQIDGRPVTLAIDPMIIASIRILGTDAPASAVQWLDRLSELPNDSFALSWADADLTLGIEAGGAPLSLESLDFAINPARFGDAAPETPDTSPSPSATPNPEPDAAPPLPDTDALLSWDYSLDSVAWPASDTVTAGSLEALAAAYEQTIVASSNLSGPAGLEATARVGSVPVIVSNSALSTLLSSAVSTSSAEQWLVGVETLVGAVATAATGPAASSAVVTLDRGVSLTDPDLGPTLDAIAAIEGIQLVGLSEVADNTGGAASVVDRPQDAETVSEVSELLRLEGLDSAFVRIAQKPSFITSERRLDLLAVLSNSWANSPLGREGAVADFRATSTTLRSSVKIVQSSSITLWADRAALPVVVENELDQAVTVFVTVRPLTPLIRVEDTYFEVVVEPKSQRKALVPVQSISNGTVELQISLHGVANQQIGSTTYVRTTVQAGWETPFTIGLGIVVVLVFIAGIVRTVVRLRRARAQRITIR